ncbi:MAG: glycogen-binding domain-containing protein [Gemmatimonadales bacterium]
MTARAPALVMLVALNAAGAQSTREVRADAGAAQVQQTGRSARDAAGVFGISWREGTPVFASQLSAAVTMASDSSSAAQAALAAAWRPAEQSAWQTEGGMTAAGFGSSIFARGTSFSGYLRERVSIDAGGVWAGGAYGGTSRDNIASHSTAVEIGGWWREGEFEVSAALSRLRSDDHPLLEAAGIFLTDSATYDFIDLTTELRWERGPLLLDATGAFRNGTRLTATSQAAFYLSAIWTLSPRYSLVVGSGRILADPVRGVPDMQISSAAIRVVLAPPRAPGPGNALRGAAFATVTQKSSGALVVVRVIADDTSQVEVAGTFSDWAPVQLARTNDAWVAEIALPPGRHRVAVRINGGPWQAPRGTARVRDEFGGEAGLIVVP